MVLLSIVKEPSRIMEKLLEMVITPLVPQAVQPSIQEIVALVSEDLMGDLDEPHEQTYQEPTESLPTHHMLQQELLQQQDELVDSHSEVREQVADLYEVLRRPQHNEISIMSTIISLSSSVTSLLHPDTRSIRGISDYHLPDEGDQEMEIVLVSMADLEVEQEGMGEIYSSLRM
jgi:hypothetical protein